MDTTGRALDPAPATMKSMAAEEYISRQRLLLKKKTKSEVEPLPCRRRNTMQTTTARTTRPTSNRRLKTGAEVPIENVPKTTTLIYISPEKTNPAPLSILFGRHSRRREGREKGERRRRHGWEDSGAVDVRAAMKVKTHVV